MGAVSHSYHFFSSFLSILERFRLSEQDLEALGWPTEELKAIRVGLSGTSCLLWS